MESQYCLDYDCNYLTILLLRYVTYGQSRISGSAHVCMISRCEPVQKSQMVSKLPTDFSVLSPAGLIYFVDFILFFEIRC